MWIYDHFPTYPIWAYYAHGRQRRCQEDPVSLPSGRLEKTTRSSAHHVAQHRPTGSETTPFYAPQSSRFGSEPPSVEDVVDVWRYAILSCRLCQKRRPTTINITQIRLYAIYFDSTGVATALLSNYTVAVSETMHEPWRRLSSLSTSCLIFDSDSQQMIKMTTRTTTIIVVVVVVRPPPPPPPPHHHHHQSSLIIIIIVGLIVLIIFTYTVFNTAGIVYLFALFTCRLPRKMDL